MARFPRTPILADRRTIPATVRGEMKVRFGARVEHGWEPPIIGLIDSLLGWPKSRLNWNEMGLWPFSVPRGMFQMPLPESKKVHEGSGTPPREMSDAGPKLLRGLLEVFLLESLDQQPKHGYALLKEMGDVFGTQPNRNRLYPLLAKLVSDGYVREVAEAGGNRTLYALTDQGKGALHSY